MSNNLGFSFFYFFGQRILEAGPVESAGYDSVSLLAEQVSHHPPSKLLCCTLSNSK